MVRIDGVAVDDVPTNIGDLTDFDSIRLALDGRGVVVRPGGDPRGQAPWESVLQTTSSVPRTCLKPTVRPV